MVIKGDKTLVYVLCFLGGVVIGLVSTNVFVSAIGGAILFYGGIILGETFIKKDIDKEDETP